MPEAYLRGSLLSARPVVGLKIKAYNYRRRSIDGGTLNMVQSSLKSPARKTARCLSVLLAAFVLLGDGFQTSAWAADHDRGLLVGTWHLVTFVDTPETGAPIQAFGSSPIGFFVFTADGHASISIMRNPPNAALTTKDPDPDVCIPDWYCSYFGTYTVDRKNELYIVHVQGSNLPTYVGTDQTRHFSIQGDKLVIEGTYEEGGQQVHTYRLLVRDVPRRSTH